MCYFDMFHFWCTFIVENHDDPHNDPSPLSSHSVNSMEYTGDMTEVWSYYTKWDIHQNDSFVKFYLFLIQTKIFTQKITAMT